MSVLKTEKDFLDKTNFCANSSLYHCLPDEKCKLHKICIQPVTSASVCVILIVKGTLFPEYVFSIPNSNIDVYELFSLFVCKLSVLDTVDTTLFDKILQKLNVSVPKATGSYTKPCALPTAHHYLATLDCEMKKSCNKPIMSPSVRLYIYNESAFKGGRLNLHEFKVGTSNSYIYYRIGFILCTFERIKTYHEEEFDNKEDNQTFNHSNVLHANVSYNTDLQYIGPIAGVIVGLIASCIMITLELIQQGKSHNGTEEIICLDKFVKLSKVKGDRPQDVELYSDVRENQTCFGQIVEKTDKNSAKSTTLDMKIKCEVLTSDCDTPEQPQHRKETVDIRVEDYKPSTCSLNSSNKPLIPRDFYNNVPLEDT
ncbi:unnamed protein product [Mytilus coruscus]|uniref:Uncharacterized protein n=1 Tax=Mytilus coruscus TaxID=42192 RepID=A0A6J8EYS0_MYTCO|nr:unnamed protein product [Mytilus coruscus]